MTMPPLPPADTLSGSLLQAVDSARAPLLFGWDSVCRAPGLWEAAHLHHASPQHLFEGIPLLSPLADEGRMAFFVLYLTLFLGMIAFLRLRGKKILPMLFAYAFSRKRLSEQLSDDLHQEYGNVWLTLLVGSSCLAMGAAFLWDDGFSWRLMGMAWLSLLLYQLLSSALVFFLGWTFNAPRCASEACLANCVGNAVTSLVLSPFVLSLFFTREEAAPLLLFALPVLLLLCLIFKWIRLFGILFEFKISVFYMILYLCTLEITPLLVAYKLLE